MYFEIRLSSSCLLSFRDLIEAISLDILIKRLFKGIPMYEGDCYIFINYELEYKVVYSKLNYSNYISINRLEELIEAGYICCIHNNNVLPTNELINRCTNDLFIFTTVYGAIYPKVELELV